MTNFENLVDAALIAQADPRTVVYQSIAPDEWNRVKACLVACHENGETLLPDDGSDPFAGILADTRPQSSEEEEAVACAAQIADLAMKGTIAAYHRQISRESAKRIVEGLRELEATPGNAMVQEYFPGYCRSAEGFAADWDAANPDRRRLSDTPTNPISAARKASGMTQTDFAAAIGTDQRSVSRWERGAFTPRPEMLAKMAQVLGCAMDDLI